MIIVFENGRLGNQLFQYAGLECLYPKEKIIYIGCDDIAEVLDNVYGKFVKKCNLPRCFSFRRAKKLLSTLVRIRVIGSIQERRNHGAYDVLKMGGLIPNVCSLESSYFQHRDVVNNLNPRFKIKPTLKNAACDWLKSLSLNDTAYKLVFMHIRRGDYLTWPRLENPAVLDLQWYLKAMDQIKEQVDSPLFIILTDDIHYARDIFGCYNDVVISENCPYVDFALMAECEHGILSASSYAWWGAWFSKRDAHKQGIYLAPKYWAGHRINEWFPAGFMSDWITYI